jgi:uncharacterized membrane protein YgaE (UPF0421/DUF939 family)
VPLVGLAVGFLVAFFVFSQKGQSMLFTSKI